MKSNKPRVIKDYEKLDQAIQEQIKLAYPKGYSEHLVFFTNQEGKRVSALPFETEDRYYLVRMTVREARDIVEKDDDFDEFGMLKDDIKEGYEDKYSDVDDIADSTADSSSNYGDNDGDDD